MPAKYTYEQVQELFIKNNCILKTETYTNQLGKLEYTASCGHSNSTAFKEFVKGAGIKCKNCALEIPTYEHVVKKFVEKKCQVTMTKEEFNQCYKNSTCKIKYNAICGHENRVSYKNFTTLNQGIHCPSCVNKNISVKLTELYSVDKLSAIKQELRCIHYLKELIGDSFTIVKAFDGCKADIIIRKNNIVEDVWVGIQVKSTLKKTEREQYYFRMNNGKYENCLIFCMCDEDKKMWLIPYEDVAGLKTIGVAQKSKYNKYEVNVENLIEKLNHYYALCRKLKFEVLDTPTSTTQKQEQEYRRLRESKLDFIEFKNNEMEGLVYDFMIGNKKVQEKVGSTMHNNIHSYLFQLIKYDCRINRKNVYQCYEKGDNDLYWLNCKDGTFYVIPEDVLFDNGHIGKCSEKYKLFVSPTNQNTSWCNAYKFDYNNLDKERLLQIVL